MRYHYAIIIASATLAAALVPGCSGSYTGMCWEHCSDAIRYGGQACGTFEPVYETLMRCACAPGVCDKECGDTLCSGEPTPTECMKCLRGTPVPDDPASFTKPCTEELFACTADQLPK